MGTDILIYLEVRPEGGAWEPVDPPDQPNRRPSDGFVVPLGPQPDAPRRLLESGILMDLNFPRDYRVFAAMAGVRAEFVTLTGNGIEPVVPPRGLPSDLSAPLVESWRGWRDGHNPSWLTRAELEQVRRMLNDHNDRDDDDAARSISRASIEEFARVMDKAQPQLRAVTRPRAEEALHALLGAMATYEAHGYETRVVFWFDC